MLTLFSALAELIRLFRELGLYILGNKSLTTTNPSLQMNYNPERHLKLTDSIVNNVYYGQFQWFGPYNRTSSPRHVAAISCGYHSKLRLVDSMTDQ